MATKAQHFRHFRGYRDQGGTKNLVSGIANHNIRVAL
jgi:hypothetical protein